jgi:hypothetical protein
MVRQAIVKELGRQKRKRYWLWKTSGVPRSVVYEGLDGDRPIPLEHAEAMMKTLGLTVVPAVPRSAELISGLPISTRARNVAMSAVKMATRTAWDKATVAELSKLTDEQLRAVSGAGEKTLAEIRAVAPASRVRN